MKKISPRTLFALLLILIGLVAFVIYKTYLQKPLISADKNPNTSEIDNNNSISTTATIESDNSLKSAVPVPIFMYHYIRDYNDPADQIGINLSVAPTTFSAEISKLKNLGYNTVSFNQYLSGKANSKSVILTFDDGYSDAYSAFKVLKNNDLIGVFYIITSKLDTAGYLSTNQIKEMSDAGMIIGSHTLSHPDLEKSSLDKAKNEIAESKILLEKITNQPIFDFCYPSGKYNASVASLVRDAGYKTAVTTKVPSKTNFVDFLELPRFRITEADNSNSLISKINKIISE